MSLSDLTGHKDAYQLLQDAQKEIRRLDRLIQKLIEDKAKLQSQLAESELRSMKAYSEASWREQFRRDGF